MTISNTYTYTATRDQIISGALRIVGGLNEGEQPTPAQLETAVEALQFLLKSWSAKLGLPLWSIRNITVPLVAGRVSYNTTTDFGLTYRPLEVLEVSRVDSSGNSTILTPVSRSDYQALSLKTSVGETNQYYYDLQREDGILYVWPVTNLTDSKLSINLRTPLADAGSSLQNLDVPSEWLRALKYGLAYDLGDEYGLPSSRQNRIGQKLEQIIDETETMAMENASVTFGFSNY